MKDYMHKIAAVLSALAVLLPQAFDIAAPPVEAVLTLVGWVGALFTDKGKLVPKKK